MFVIFNINQYCTYLCKDYIFGLFLSVIFLVKLFLFSLTCMQLVFTERLLHLSLDDRRKEYRRQDFISLDKILTWREKNRCK